MAKHVRFEELYPSRPRTQWLLTVSLLIAITLFVVGLCIGVFGIRSGDTFDCGESYASFLPLTATESSSVLPIPFFAEHVVRDKMFAEFQADNIRKHLLNLTKESHPAGTPANNRVAEYIRTFLSLHLGADNVSESLYDILLSRPNNSNPNVVKVVSADGEDHTVLRNKETQKAYDFDSAVFGFSAQGFVESDVLFYVNTGSDHDYELLRKQGLLDQINGSVVLLRYGGFRGAQVEKAAEHGAKAVLLYLDPSAVAKYGTDESKVFPNGSWMPDSAMERGVLSTYKGDPLSQSFVSEIESKTKYRTALKEVHLPAIPAVPIGYGDAQKLFDLMDNSTGLPSHLWGPSEYMRYSFGGKLREGRKITVKTTNFNERSVIKNIIGQIRGCQEPDRYVILGNHYDAWTMGGVDPNSGTATLLEIARVMGVLRKRDSWCPRRTIILASWDAEEYGLIGSTEWVEENMHILQERAVAYINIDAAVRGRLSFFALGVPLLSNVIYSATRLVPDPSGSSDNKISVYDVWANTTKGSPQVYSLGAGSDYASFVNMVGIPSADLRYNGEVANPSYHTAFETYEYVAQQVDPTFEYHVAVGKIWSEMVRNIADSAIVPFCVTDKAEHMNVSWHQVRQDILAENSTETPYDFSTEIDFDGMNLAIGEFERIAQIFSEDTKAAMSDGRQKSALLMRQLNDKLIKLDRMFVLPEGLPGRPLYRHVLHAPSKSSAYGGSSFPGIVDCVAGVLQARKKNDPAEEQKWLNELRLHSTKVIQLIDRAARFLSPTFSGLYQSP